MKNAKLIDCAQGSPEWDSQRLGIPTASNFHKILAKGKGETRKSYMKHLAAERLTGQKIGFPINDAIRWGSEKEPEARAAYEFHSGNDCQIVGFYTTGSFGCSPDGLVGDAGTVEFKCPLTTTHIETVLSGKMPEKHKAQVQGQLWITGRNWCDFVSFDPRITHAADYFCVRVSRDDQYIADLEEAVNTFCSDLEDMIARYKRG